MLYAFELRKLRMRRCCSSFGFDVRLTHNRSLSLHPRLEEVEVFFSYHTQHIYSSTAIRGCPLSLPLLVVQA